MTTRRLRVLHVASFMGNIGDNANHLGFRPWFERVSQANVEWTPLEIREFYWKERFWDKSFVEMANSHDLVVIGGGNYFELWVEDSPTGTSIAIEPSLFEEITSPIYFNALGVDAGQGVPETSKSNFTRFMNRLSSDSKYLVSVRNDGALKTLNKHFGSDYSDSVYPIPDGGFFASIQASSDKCGFTMEEGRRYIGINVAGDMPEVRFNGFSDPSDFCREMAEAIERIAKEYDDTCFVFFPHIYRDLDQISEVISYLNDRLRRTRIRVAPYGSGDSASEDLLQLYSICDLILAMRFHANVCPIGLERQTLGLSCYPQIYNLYEEIGQLDRVVDVSKPGFLSVLFEKVGDVFLHPERFTATPSEIKSQVVGERNDFELILKNWLQANSLANQYR